MLLQPETLIEDYRIVRRLGSGGMADVYEAEELALRRHVALKVLPRAQAMQSDAVIRFQRESLAVAALNHRGIVQIYKVGNDPGLGLLFYSMRLLRGGDLSAAIRRGLTLRQTLTVLRELADAFAHAHAHGLVHRDVKPGNVMFDDKGFPVITDFGIAKLRDQTRLTVTGMAMGTPTYISPEQASGKPVDARSDLYSLGVMLYEMLAGRPPFEAEHVTGVIFKHLSEPVPQLPSPYAELQPLVEALMAKDREARVASGEDLARRITPLLEAAGGPDWVSIPERGPEEISTLPTRRSGAAIAAPDAATMMSEAVPAAPTLLTTAPTQTVDPPPRRGPLLTAIAASVAVLAVAAWVYWPRAPQPASSTTSTTSAASTPPAALAPPAALPAPPAAQPPSATELAPQPQAGPAASAPVASAAPAPAPAPARPLPRPRREPAAPAKPAESAEALPRTPAEPVAVAPAVTAPVEAPTPLAAAPAPPPAVSTPEPVAPASESAAQAPAEDEAEKKRKDRARRSGGF